MSIQLMQRAINTQGVAAAWRGPTPADGSALTEAYVAELVDGLPRLVYGDGETQTVDLAQLAADYDVLMDVAADESIRSAKIAEIKALGLERIGTRIPALANMDLLAMVVELVQSAMLNPPQAGSDAAACADIYVYARDKIVLAKTAPIAQVAAYDPSADVDFPS